MINHKKEFTDTFKKLTYRNQSWRIWSDFIEMSAIALRNSTNYGTSYKRLEDRYLELINAYERQDQELFPKLLATVIRALDYNPEQDFLGELFQELDLSSHWKGQFFTPYNLCRMVADMQVGNVARQVEEKGFISVNDPACGAGALLIAFANSVRELGINYQHDVLFVAQDIDQTAALMCYIQLTLLGCPGYVIIGDTLARPGLHADNDIWYMPMFYRRLWIPKKTNVQKSVEPDQEPLIRPEVMAENLVQLTLF